MVFFNKISLFGLLVLGVSGCTMTTVAPVEQMQKKIQTRPEAVAKSRDVVKKQPFHQYRCDHNKIVQVRAVSNKKNSPLTVTFNQSSYKLSPTVSKMGKKYSNIRWVWLEAFDGTATLSDNAHKLLASNCRKMVEK